MELTRRKKGCTHVRQSFADLLILEATHYHLSQVIWTPTFGLVRGGNPDPRPLRTEAPELQEERRIIKVGQWTDTPSIALCFSLNCIQQNNWRRALYPSALTSSRFHFHQSSEEYIASLRGSYLPGASLCVLTARY